MKTVPSVKLTEAILLIFHTASVGEAKPNDQVRGYRQRLVTGRTQPLQVRLHLRHGLHRHGRHAALHTRCRLFRRKPQDQDVACVYW